MRREARSARRVHAGIRRSARKNCPAIRFDVAGLRTYQSLWRARAKNRISGFLALADEVCRGRQAEADRERDRPGDPCRTVVRIGRRELCREMHLQLRPQLVEPFR